MAALITTSQKHFEAGERELKLGHLDRARVEFDRAVDVLLESPYGARTDARMREHFDRLIDRISALRSERARQGDGFAEKKYEPASIDELLKIATFPKPDADARRSTRSRTDLATHRPRHPDSRRTSASWRRWNCCRGGSGLRAGQPEPRPQYLPMIQNVFRAEGLPLDLAFIPIIESGFKTNALSKASAKGPWQFMVPTAKDHGLKTNWYHRRALGLREVHGRGGEVPQDAVEHVRRRLAPGARGLQRRAGTGAARDEEFGRRGFLDADRVVTFLPKETREYVPLILAAMIVGRNPAQYGFEIADGGADRLTTRSP